MIKPQTLKGFRDFLPLEARKRQYVINTLKKVFEQFGFEPLETPVLEYEEILTGKYGEEGDKLMYRFEDLGQRRVAMRYDQTVPLARVVAQYQNQIALPFKRYQISPVWRAENTQKGRYRELVQCDIDTVGTDSALADAEVIQAALSAYQKLGFKNFKILLNDRDIFSKTFIDYPAGLLPSLITAIDKLNKIGEQGVIDELINRNNQNPESAKKLLDSIREAKPTQRILDILAILDQMKIDGTYIDFTPTLARGMNYYTGLIFEIETPDYPHGSIGGGGRYNNLIGLFTKKQIPAVGFALGFDRTLEAMEQLNLFPDKIALSTTTVLVTIFTSNLEYKSIEICSRLRSEGISTEIYLGEIKEKNPLEKQLKYADQKGIPFAIIIGGEEIKENKLILKNLKTHEQKKLTLDEIIDILTL